MLSDFSNDLGTGLHDILDQEDINDPATGQTFHGVDAESTSILDNQLHRVEAEQDKFEKALDDQRILQDKLQRFKDDSMAIHEQFEQADQTLKGSKVTTSDTAKVRKEFVMLIRQLLEKHPEWLPEIRELASAAISPLEESTKVTRERLQTLEAESPKSRDLKESLQQGNLKIAELHSNWNLYASCWQASRVNRQDSEMKPKSWLILCVNLFISHMWSWRRTEKKLKR